MKIRARGKCSYEMVVLEIKRRNKYNGFDNIAIYPYSSFIMMNMDLSSCMYGKSKITGYPLGV